MVPKPPRLSYKKNQKPYSSQEAFASGGTTTRASATPSGSIIQQVKSTYFSKNNILLAIMISIIVLGWTGVYLLFLHQPKYATTAKVIVKDSAITNRYIEPENAFRIQTTSSNNANPVLNTMELIYGNEVSKAVYNYFYQRHPEELEKLEVTNFKEWHEFYEDGKSFIKATNKAGTDIITVNFAWSDPVIAQEVLEQILLSFQEASRNLNASEYSLRRDYLRKQIVEMNKQLETVRNDKSLLKQDTLTLDVVQAGSSLEMTQLDLKNKISQIESEMNGKLAEGKRYQSLLGMDSTQAVLASMVGQNTQLASLQDKLYKLHDTYAQLNSYYTENNPNVAEVKSQIDQTQEDIEAEMRRSMGKSYTEAKSRTAFTSISDPNRATMVANLVSSEAAAMGLKEQVRAMRSRLGEVESRIRTTPGIAAKLSNIEDQEMTLSKSLASLREKLAEFTLRETQTVSNVFVVAPPLTPIKPQFPQEKHILVLGLIAAVLLSAAVIFIKEQVKSYRRNKQQQADHFSTRFDESFPPFSPYEHEYTQQERQTVHTN